MNTRKIAAIGAVLRGALMVIAGVVTWILASDTLESTGGATTPSSTARTRCGRWP